MSGSERIPESDNRRKKGTLDARVPRLELRALKEHKKGIELSVFTESYCCILGQPQGRETVQRGAAKKTIVSKQSQLLTILTEAWPTLSEDLINPTRINELSIWFESPCVSIARAVRGGIYVCKELVWSAERKCLPKANSAECARRPGTVSIHPRPLINVMFDC